MDGWPSLRTDSINSQTSAHHPESTCSSMRSPSSPISTAGCGVCEQGRVSAASTSRLDSYDSITSGAGFSVGSFESAYSDVRASSSTEQEASGHDGSMPSDALGLASKVREDQGRTRDMSIAKNTPKRSRLGRPLERVLKAHWQRKELVEHELLSSRSRESETSPHEPECPSVSDLFLMEAEKQRRLLVASMARTRSSGPR